MSMPTGRIESAPMRRWVLIFLLLVVPFQMVWGAAAPYCAHESTVAAKKHLGHHEHLHQGDDQQSAAADENSAAIGAYHADCESCHPGTSAVLASPAIAFDVLPDGADDGAPSWRYQSHVPSGPERPDRIQLAAAA